MREAAARGPSIRAMRMKLALPILLVALLAACGGTNPGSTTKPGATAGQGKTNPPGAQVDCAKLEAAAKQLIGIQLLAQLSTPGTIESIKSLGTLDLDAMLTALGDLHALDDVASPLGDAKASLDHYEAAARAAKDLFAMEPVTQAAIDAFNKEHVGTITDFLGKQMAISGAMGEAGC